MRKTLIIISIVVILCFYAGSDVNKAVCPTDKVYAYADENSETFCREMNTRGIIAGLQKSDSESLGFDIMMDVDDARTFRYELYASHPEVTLAYSPRITLTGYSSDAEIATGIRVTKLSESGGQARYEELENAVSEIIQEMSGADDATKVRAVKRWIKRNCDYTKHMTNMWDESLYGCLVRGSATCLGYSEGFYYMMKRLHVPCRIVTNQYHAWNEVYLKGEWKKVDLTL